MTQRSKYVSVQAQRYLAYKEQIGWYAKGNGVVLSHAPFEVTALVHIRHDKPDMDVDNLAKAFMDGLNKIAWHDDRQVILLHISKQYVSGEEWAEIEIREVGA